MASSLSDRLDRIREGAAGRIPADALRVMHAATEDLERSGLAQRAIGTGDAAPEFALADAFGEMVSLAGLRGSGPVVLTFFRGHW
ncbi:MAG TPA: hypothetical protein VMT85_15845 [Thermoanaerobaculia bacterium]|nr:hypothetical protein [Thermoanaerobaculia bacterium]